MLAAVWFAELVHVLLVFCVALVAWNSLVVSIGVVDGFGLWEVAVESAIAAGLELAGLAFGENLFEA
ncbi:hypothetical protein [Streptomyces sp. NPDC047725]|uniref:hypothetical protein n=1 Tax=Streptomyces sp. NPDC047725 TaxID=3365487 RepID=UPI003717E614